MKILWLEDEKITIFTEMKKLTKKQEVHQFSRIMHLMNYLEENEIASNDIFILDILLKNEKNFYIGNKHIHIAEAGMAGITFFKEYLKDKFPDNTIIFYTVTIDKKGDSVYQLYEEHIKKICKRENIYFIGKPEMNIRFKDVLKSKGVVWSS